MQIKSLLDSSDCSNVDLVGGSTGASRPVSMIGLIEAPDIEEYLMPTQLLLTTGYHYYQDISKLDHLLTRMAEVGCAGLGIKAGRYFNSIPQDIIDRADALGLPLLITPADQNLSSVVKKMTEIVIGADALGLRRTIKENQELSALGMANANYVTVLDRITDFFGRDIVVLNSHLVVTQTNTHLRTQKESLSAAFQDSQTNYFNLNEPVGIHYQNSEVTIIPLMVMHSENKAFIAVFDLIRTTAFDELQLQQIQNVLSLMNSRTDVAKDSALRQRNDFFITLLAGDVAPQILEKFLGQWHLDANDNYYCGVCSVIPDKRGTLISSRVTEQIQRLTDWFIDEYHLKVTCFSHNQKVVFAISEKHTPNHFLEALQRFLMKQLSPKYVIKMGYSHSKLPMADLSSLFHEATEAYNLSLQEKTTIIEFRPKKVSELLGLVPSLEAKSFVQELLGPLLTLPNHDETKSLLKTLRAYFYYNRQPTSVAKALYIHRNTVTYRLQKIAELLEVDLQDPDVCDRLNLALHLQNLK